MKQADLSEWLRTGQAARRIGISPQYLMRMIARGEIDAVETPLGYLYDPDEVERVVHARNELRKEAEAAT